MKRLMMILLALAAATAAFAVGQRENGDFTKADVTTLVVEADTFAVDVSVAHGNDLSMHISDYPNGYTVYHSTNGTQVRVWVERDFPIFAHGRGGKLVFTVPQSVELTVDNSTGSVRVSGLSGGALRVDTSTGSISLESITGETRVTSSTGSIDMDRMNGRIDVTSTTGSVSISDLEGHVVASSSTGSQSYTDIAGSIDARSTTGSVELRNVKGEIHLQTSTGTQVARALEITGNSSFNATTGSIKIDLANELDTIEFDLRSTTGSLEVGPDRSQGRLFLAGTTFTVTAVTSTGSQHFF